MTINPEDVFKLITLAESDFRSGLGKLTQLRTYLSAMNLPQTSRKVCPECGLTFAGTSKLSDHLHVTHGHAT